MNTSGNNSASLQQRFDAALAELEQGGIEVSKRFGAGRLPGELEKIAVGNGNSIWGVNPTSDIFHVNPNMGKLLGSLPTCYHNDNLPQ
jgi:hypothetical protein